MPGILSLAAIKIIEREVDKLFDRAAARYLGPAAMDKRIYVGFKNELSLPGIFMAAAREEGAVPDKKIIEALTRNASTYLDAYRASTKAQVVKKVQSFLQQAEIGGVKTDLKTVLGGELTDVWGKATSEVKRMVDTEASNARNMGTLEGILAVNASEGIEDPVIYFVVVRDQYLCDECKRLHLLDDEVTPRLWKLSDVGHGYHKKKESNPKIGGLHPHCRCTMVTLMPGYGFGTDGMVKFVSLDHNEFKKQHGALEKSEPLEKMALIHDDPEKPMTVYRVQNERGEGPYQGSNPPTFDRTYGTNKNYLNSPAPVDDFDDGDLHAWGKRRGQLVGFATPDLKPRIPYLFGFHKPEHATDWFGPQAMSHLAAQGYHLHEVKAKQVRSSYSGQQLMFLPHPDYQPVKLGSADPVVKSEGLPKPVPEYKPTHLRPPKYPSSHAVKVQPFPVNTDLPWDEDSKQFADQFEPHAPLWHEIHSHIQKIVGMPQTPIRHIEVDRHMDHALGVWQSNHQRLAVTPKVASETMRYFHPDGGYGDKRGGMDALSTVVHEMFHAAGHQGAFAEYEGMKHPTPKHAALEEAMTEALADHYHPEVADGMWNSPISDSRPPLFRLDDTDSGGAATPRLTRPVAYSRNVRQLGHLISRIERLHEHDPNLINDDFDEVDRDARLHHAVINHSLAMKRMDAWDRYHHLTDHLLNAYDIHDDHRDKHGQYLMMRNRVMNYLTRYLYSDHEPHMLDLLMKHAVAGYNTGALPAGSFGWDQFYK